MAKNGKIFDENGNLIYPLTVSTEVKDPTSGQTVKAQINEINNKIVDEIGPEIDQIAEVVGGVETEIQIDLTSGGTWTDGKAIISSGGSEGAQTNGSSKSFILIDISEHIGETLYYTRLKSTVSSGSTGLAFLDSNGVGSANVISGAGENSVFGAAEDGYEPSSITIPSGAKYVGITFWKDDKDDFQAYVLGTMMSDGIKKDVENLQDWKEGLDAEGIPFNKLGTTLQSDNAQGAIKELDDKLDDVAESIICRNLINKNDSDVQEGKYMSNGIATNSNYMLSAPIPVVSGQSYVFSNSGSATNARYVSYLVNKTDTSRVSYDENTSSFIVPSGKNFVRLSIAKTTWENKPQLEQGTTPTDYQVYFEKYSQVKLRNKQVTKDKLGDDVNLGSVTFKSFRTNGTIVNGETLNTPMVHIRKNTILVAIIKGTLENVLVGVGYGDYMGRWLDITATEVKVYSYTNSSLLVTTLTHGLTFGEQTTIVIDCGNGTTTNVAHIKITTELGAVYETTLSAWGYGRPFVKNLGTTSVDAVLSFFPKDITKRVWLFGDSYFSYESSARWLYYLITDGHVGYLTNAQSGLGAPQAYTDLVNLLTLGFRPTYLVWCLGMNGSTSESQVDGQYVINSTQKRDIDNVVALCNTYGIELVLATIPTVPERQKTGFNIYVKSLGVRYIDFADAVGADSSGQWYSGLLSSDGVHPTETGAKVLYARALLDCPEIAIDE